MANEADILSAESLTVSDQTVAGGTPSSKPIRKRGFHRALKRGEQWAKVKSCFTFIADRNVKEMYAYTINNNEYLGLMNQIEENLKD